MVRLILKYLNKVKQLIVIIPLIVVIMLFSGLYFADKNSEPEFGSKTERVMFETKNKSPKYVITLPSKKKKTEAVPVKQVSKKQEKTQPDETVKTNNEKLQELDIPFLSQLPSVENKSVLSHIDFLDSITENVDNVFLPIMNGTQKAWEVYGRKVSVMPMFNKVAIVIKNMGKNKINTDLIINRMPSDVSFSFSPYGYDVSRNIRVSRENGHETYWDMILPSRNYLFEDTGDLSLNFSQIPVENVSVLEKVLAKSPVVGGFVISDGIDDAAHKDQFTEIMNMLKRRGLLMLDASHNSNINEYNVDGLDRIKADIVIDSEFDRAIVKEKLAQAEQIAYRNGNVVVVLDPKPVAVLAVMEWLSTFSKQMTYEEMKAANVTSFEKPLILVPLSNLAVEY